MDDDGVRGDLEAARMHPWSWDRVSDRTTWTPGVAELFGVSLEEFDGTLAGFLSLVHEDDRARVHATIERALSGDADEFEVEHRVLPRAGRVRWLHGRGTVLRDETGSPRAIRGVVWDVTDRKQTELRAARMRRLFAIVAAINRESARGDSRAFLAAACRIAVDEGGFRFAWIGERDSSGRVVPLASAGHEEGYLQLDGIRTIGTAPKEGPTMRAIRERKPVVCNDTANDPAYAPFRDPALARGFRASAAFPFERDGVAFGTLNVYADQPGVFEQEEVELLWRLAADIGYALERLEREERYRALFEQAGDGIVVFDDKGRVIDANTAFCAMHGWARDELLGQDVFSLIGGASQAIRARVTATLDRGEVFRGERSAKRKDGTTFDVETSVKALHSGVRLAVVRDVGDRNRLRATMEQNERLLALGRLARGVAHEINNPLSYVVLSFDEIELSLRRKEPDAFDRRRAALSRARGGADRIRRIVRDLSAFGRGDDEAIEPVDLRAVLGSAINLAESTIKPRARIVTAWGAQRLAKANAHRLGQVAVNLLVNAADATAEGAPDRNEIRVSTTDDGDQVVFSVSDTGSGMDRETMSRIFDPFFTTKPIGEGTGLGLAIAHAIVTRMGGSIDVASEPGRGATFTVRLPFWTTSKHTSRLEAPAACSTPRPRRRILVVDDETNVRDVLARSLDGDDVTVASGAFEAAEICRTKDFDCILCDVTMPAGDGVDMLEALRAQGRGLEQRLVFMSGGASSTRAESLLARAQPPHLDKPFGIGELRDLIERVAPK
jgi:PAS domain S-box-containing protein